MSFDTQEQLRVFPLTSAEDQTHNSRYSRSNAYRTDQQHYYNYNIPGTNFAGPSENQRIRLSLESGLDDEVTETLDTLIQKSKKGPQELNLKGQYSFLVEYLTFYLNCKAFNANAENGDLDKSLDSALILRNLAQDIDNSQVISMNQAIRGALLAVLESPIITGDQFSHANFDQCKELLRFTMDIIEAISSYLAPAPADDPLFLALVRLLEVLDDRSTTTTILRSMSRMMYNSRKSGDAPDNITDDILNRVVSYLALGANENDDDELILTSLDFLYQFIQHNRVERLLASDLRAATLQSFLFKLLVYKLDYKTEFTQQMEPLTLIHRVKEPVPENVPVLDQTLVDELNELAEPERATAWLRCSFKASPEAQVTQISLWRAYAEQFSPYTKSHGIKLQAAVDFIKNVQHAFPRSAAMVINQPDDNTKKFVINGIQPRETSVSIAQGKEEVIDASAIPERKPKPTYETAEESVQEPVKLFQYNWNDYLALNEINTSTCLLLSQLVQSPAGVALFKGKGNDLIDRLMCVPNLLPYVNDVLTKIEY